MGHFPEELRVLQVTPALGPGGAEHVAAYLGWIFSTPDTVALCSVYGGAYADYLRARNVSFRIFESVWSQEKRKNFVLQALRRWRSSRLENPVLSARTVRLAPQKDFLSGVPRFKEWFEDLLAGTAYDVAHIHQLSCLGVSETAKAKTKKVVYSHHNILSERHGDEDIAFLKQQLRHVDHVVCVSRKSLDDFAMVTGFPAARMTALPNPSFLAGGLRRNVTAVRSAGTASNLHPTKGIDILLEAWKLLLEKGIQVPLQIAGGSIPDVACWKRVAAKMGLSRSVRFLGETAGEAGMNRFYETVDAVIIPSRTEASTLQGLEALSKGIPVIASDIPGLRETIGAAGLFFKSEDPAELAGCVERLVNDQALAGGFSTAGYEHWQRNFSPGRIKSDYEKIYR